VWSVVVSEMIFLAFYVRAVFVRCKHAQIKKMKKNEKGDVTQTSIKS
jgi:hypothetical protein